jgi:hypothetical protein
LTAIEKRLGEFAVPRVTIGFRVIQEVTLPSPVHIIYKVIDLRLWKDTEEFPPHSRPARNPGIKCVMF